jgi:hypothetical protein
VRYTLTGPIRDVVVCHCDACGEAAGGPWAASATRREHLVVETPAVVRWTRAAVSSHGASRGFCLRCEGYLFWDAPARETVSFGIDTLDDRGAGLEVAAHIWVADGASSPLGAQGAEVAEEGLAPDTVVPWHDPV